MQLNDKKQQGILKNKMKTFLLINIMSLIVR